MEWRGSNKKGQRESNERKMAASIDRTLGHRRRNKLRSRVMLTNTDRHGLAVQPTALEVIAAEAV